MNFKHLNNNKLQTKSGIVLFVVLGGIFVLTILVLSYNHLVQGANVSEKPITTSIVRIG
jgi:Tfp pilus assembly protein PilX